MSSITEMIEAMNKEGRLHVRERIVFSWGDRETCKNGFVSIYQQIDKTISEYIHLPEYDEVIDWMMNTEGKGLLLMGDVGRGKSNIIGGVIPTLLRCKQVHVRAIHAQDMGKRMQVPQGLSAETHLDYLINSGYPIIDDLGVESIINDYGSKSEGFNAIINAAERYCKPMFITTNLTGEELLDRYGDRTLDRLKHLCRIIIFKGNSMRE